MTALAIYRRLFRFARPIGLHLVALLGLSLAATPLALLAPLPLKIVVDTVIGRHPLPAFLERILPAGVAGSQQGALVLAIVMTLSIALLGMGQRWHLQKLGGSQLGMLVALTEHVGRAIGEPVVVPSTAT